MTDTFTPHGYYGVCNNYSIEVQLSDSNDAARLNDNGEITDWFEIEFIPDEDDPDESIAVIDPEGYNIPLNYVMRI